VPEAGRGHSRFGGTLVEEVGAALMIGVQANRFLNASTSVLIAAFSRRSFANSRLSELASACAAAISLLRSTSFRALSSEGPSAARSSGEARGLSTKALTHMAGLHRVRIDTVERGGRNIAVDDIERLARALGLDPACLMK
jgi:hypothetical protein